MVKERLLQADAQEKGWLLDGYPRSYSQSMALENLGIRPDIFILLDVSAHAQLYQAIDM
jgi:adenylate kinase